MPGKDQNQAQLYPGGVDIENNYEFHPGVCILPLAEDPPTDPEALKTWSPVVKLQLHAPYRVRRQRYAVQKQNNPPVVPAAADTGKFLFVGGSLSVINGLNGTLANFDWIVSTEYTYVEDCVSRNEDGFVLGAPPYETMIESANAQQFGGLQSNLPTEMGPQVGAVAAAGTEAKVGWIMSQSLFAQTSTIQGYGYNCRSFLPGKFLDDDIANQ